MIYTNQPKAKESIIQEFDAFTYTVPNFPNEDCGSIAFELTGEGVDNFIFLDSTFRKIEVFGKYETSAVYDLKLTAYLSRYVYLK